MIWNKNLRLDVKRIVTWELSRAGSLMRFNLKPMFNATGIGGAGTNLGDVVILDSRADYHIRHRDYGILKGRKI